MFVASLRPTAVAQLRFAVDAVLAAARLPHPKPSTLAACPTLWTLIVDRDQLFLLPGAFPDPAIGSGFFHCIECARIEGLLSYQPGLRARIDVHYILHARPRAAL